MGSQREEAKTASRKSAPFVRILRVPGPVAQQIRSRFAAEKSVGGVSAAREFGPASSKTNGTGTLCTISRQYKKPGST